MKILLDECLPVNFRNSFSHHETHTALRAGFTGKKNGDLIRSAQLAGYQILLTLDQGIPYQQSPEGREIAIVVLRSRTNQLEDLLPLVGSILQSLEAIQPGEHFPIVG
jgi:predicted nuclease of predicted toxin-antitoxin system